MTSFYGKTFKNLTDWFFKKKQSNLAKNWSCKSDIDFLSKLLQCVFMLPQHYHQQDKNSRE